MKAFVAALAALSCSAVADALFFDQIVTSGATGTTLVLASGSAGVVPTAAAIAGGALVLKALGLAALSVAASQSRAKRSTEAEEDVTFTLIARNEPSACYRRLICDIATGTMPKSENDVIVSLFNKDVPITSAKYDYTVAAEVGKALKNIDSCELRYSCPLTGAEIAKLL